MRLVTFSVGTDTTETRLGAHVQDRVIELPGAYAAWRRSVDPEGGVVQQFPKDLLGYLEAPDPVRASANRVIEFVERGDNLLALEAAGLAYPAGEVNYWPPILAPRKIICVGQNYRTHVAEMGRELPKYPTLFAKFANTLTGHRRPIILPRVSQSVDYEGELAFVIGRRAKDISPGEALAFVAGYTVFNDVSVRDFQYRTLQWLQGKSFDGTGPIGPALVTPDEVGDPGKLDLVTRVNGEVRQSANTSDFIFVVPELVSYLSHILTLEPGDIVPTGTPGGVGYARKPQVFLQAGDVVQVEISGVGLLENPVVAPREEG